MGLLIEAMALRWNVHNDLRAFLTVSILGGFVFSADFALLMGRHDYLGAAIYLFASVALSIAGLFAGLAIVRAL
jgi:CrcB protein